jgi:CubicO group peptidase (beta-lactamase class C family)
LRHDRPLSLFTKIHQPTALSSGKIERRRDGASLWYALTGEDPALFALGIHGQWLFVDRARNLVIAKVSSQNEPLDPEKIALAMSAFRAIRQFLR